MKWLNLAHCEILSSLAPLAGCVALEKLNLNHCHSVHQISAIGTLEKLEVLDLGACPGIVDLAALGLCHRLRSCDVSWTQISDPTAIFLPTPPTHQHSGTAHENRTWARGCPNLSVLKLLHCQLTKGSLEKLLEGLPNLSIVANEDEGQPLD